ncbi:unnamed protein product [Cuscuta epithymum]|uniref:Uncharacterized protein n=1 Tax=Cuscuta epithymum TaxID=186058 RepID=A0AAV0E4X6_9ASTE|nr:unnamed protein product [Cuscuta epithymum]
MFAVLQGPPHGLRRKIAPPLHGRRRHYRAPAVPGTGGAVRRVNDGGVRSSAVRTLPMDAGECRSPTGIPERASRFLRLLILFRGSDH